jgi:thiol-disulfide isomerase/thioredoxin
MRFLIIFIFLISSSSANEVTSIKNLAINKELKKYDSLTFLDAKNNLINLNDFKGSLILLNFWATWCAPCKEEMPSLDLLQSHKDLDNLKIFPINVGQDNIEKSLKFFEDLEINNLKVYFDSPITLAKKLGLRGIPTSIIFNKDGSEFARIIGSIDFEDKKFIEWLANYN